MFPVIVELTIDTVPELTYIPAPAFGVAGIVRSFPEIVEFVISAVPEAM